jgi:adenosine kinase
MQSNILISGSLAYDYIMDFPDSFKHHILPEHIHMLNVSFVVDKLEKNIGGCAGNIGYTMNLLEGSPLVFGPLGTDGEEYLKHFKTLNIDTSYMPISKNVLSSSAYITTDKDDNQINAFYPGAGNEATDLHVADVNPKPTFAIIGPTKKEAMVQHAKECYDEHIPFCFDPGQQITVLSPQELMAAIGQSTMLIGNDYEMKMIEKKTGWDKNELFEHVEVVITTLGDKGSVIATKNEIFEIQPCSPTSIEDPTGAGDSYRAGFFTAYAAGKDLKTCGQVGSVAAVYAVEKYGTQNHAFDIVEFGERYERTYGSTIHLR